MSDPVPDARPLPLSKPVRLTGRELGRDDVPIDDVPITALRAAALAYAREHVQGRVAFNGPTGWAVTVGRRGINKTLNHAARREHVQSVPALLTLLERAVLVFSEANRDADEARSVPFAHTLIAALVLGDGAAAVAYRVRLLVKETNEGYRFCDHDLSPPPGP